MGDEVNEVMEGQEPTLTRDQLIELVADGQRALGQGRADEALMVAESVLESDSDLPAAWALKGDALERLNRLPEALSCYEKVIELKPDSTLDRIRANHLRKLAMVDELAVPVTAPNRKQALLAAVAATVLVVSVGTAVMLASQPAAASVTNIEETTGGQGDMTTFNTPAPVPTGTPNSTFLPNTPNPAGNSSAVPPSEGYLHLPPGVNNLGNGARQLPGVQNNNLVSDEGEVPPVNPVVIASNNDGNPAQNGGNGRNVENDPEPPINDSGFAPPGRKEDDPGFIEIKNSENQGRPNNSGGEIIPSQNDEDARKTAETLINVARQDFLRGDYAKAADAYEKALRAGASRGSTNQRLAQCYERMGRKADGIQAYERAIQSYQSDLASGGDSNRLNGAIEVCRQAIKNLRGG